MMRVTNVNPLVPAMDWKNLVRSIAPTIGTALGGPLAGAAVKFIADKLLGNSAATEDEVGAAIAGASPDQLIKLKELDNQFKMQMQQLKIDVYKLQKEETDSARNRQVMMHDWTPSILAILFISIYLIFSFYMLKDNLISQPMQIFMSNLTTIVMLIMSYFFGSSSDTKLKNLNDLRK